jgi:hypothetical protein
MRGHAPSPRLTAIVLAYVTLVALVAVWHEARPTWNRLGEETRAFAELSDAERVDLASNHTGVSASLFHFVAGHLRSGDRVYFHVPRVPYGTLDLHDTVAALGRYYLLPAVEVTSLEEATVIVSYDADPDEFGLRFVEQKPFGRDVFLSRVRLP